MAKAPQTAGDAEGAQAKADAEKTGAGKIVRVRSVSATGRRRAGYGFTQEPSDIPAADLSEEQIELLQSDPLLVVDLIDAD
ncbi:MAG: hypothetical protein KGL44_03670 [Sphingomonadales bacterium]|nr:hypothetical protein [Sphingomonadales bacterium]